MESFLYCLSSKKMLKYCQIQLPNDNTFEVKTSDIVEQITCLIIYFAMFLTWFVPSKNVFQSSERKNRNRIEKNNGYWLHRKIAHLLAIRGKFCFCLSQIGVAYLILFISKDWFGNRSFFRNSATAMKIVSKLGRTP